MISLSAHAGHRFENLHSDELPGVEIVRAHHTGPTGKWQFVPMVRVSLLVAGRVRIWSHGRGTVLEPGEAMINPPHCTPRILERLSASSESLTAYLAPSVLGTRGARLVAQKNVHVTASPLVRTELEALAAAIEEADSRARLEERVHALATAALSVEGDPATRLLPGGPLRSEIALVRRIIQDRFAQQIGLDDLAAAAGLSKFHLLRLFREEVGTTPHAYQLHLRVSLARERLEEGASAAEVALECGFADQAHFTRAFKRIVGYTPGAFKRYA